MIPVGNRVLVKPDAVDEVSKGGVYLPSPVQVKVAYGKVIAVGEGQDVPYKIKPGCRVGYFSHAGIPVEDLLILSASEVLLII